MTPTTNLRTAGIPLDQKLFTRAIAKAREVKPHVMHVGAHYAVLMSDHRTWAHVTFTVLDGRLYASCNCKAHRLGDHGKPIPCYHIAAAANSKKATAEIADEPDACPNEPNCAPGICDSSCEIASAMADEVYRHFSHADAVLVKPEGVNRYMREGWEL